MLKEINWGIIGCGSVCEYKSGPAFNLPEGSRLVAVMRRNAELAEDFAKRHKVSKWYTNADELINDPEINAIYIATPPDSHAEYAIKALNSGKTTYVEKPMAVNFQECEQMLQASHKNEVPLYVAYYRRCWPYFEKVKELISEGVMGKILSIRLTHITPPKRKDFENGLNWRLNPEFPMSGYFYDLACHQLDILDFLIGTIDDASGNAANLGGFYQPEDTITATLKFKSGILGSCLWCYVGEEGKYVDEVKILGSSGNLSFSISTVHPIEVSRGDEKQSFKYDKPKPVQFHMVDAIIKNARRKQVFHENKESAANCSLIMDKIMGNARP